MTPMSALLRATCTIVGVLTTCGVAARSEVSLASGESCALETLIGSGRSCSEEPPMAVSLKRGSVLLQKRTAIGRGVVENRPKGQHHYSAVAVPLPSANQPANNPFDSQFSHELSQQVSSQPPSKRREQSASQLFHKRFEQFASQLMPQRTKPSASRLNFKRGEQSAESASRAMGGNAKQEFALRSANFTTSLQQANLQRQSSFPLVDAMPPLQQDLIWLPASAVSTLSALSSELNAIVAVDGNRSFADLLDDANGIPVVASEMYLRPVSVTMYVVMWLTTLTLMLHTSLACARNADELSGNLRPSFHTLVLAAAARNSPYAPVMCILFLANRMRVLSITDGLGDPSLWVRVCEVVATAGITLQIASVLIAGRAASVQYQVQQPLVGDEQGNGEPGAASSGAQVPSEKRSPLALSGLKWVSALALYGGLAGVAGGILYDPQLVNASNAVTAAAFLSLFFFVVEFNRWAGERASDILDEIAEEEERAVVIAAPEDDDTMAKASAKLQEIKGKIKDTAKQSGAAEAVSSFNAGVSAASSTAQKAPMMAVLFLAARMRHMQAFPPDGTPPFHTSVAFALTPTFLLFELLVSVYIGTTGTEEIGYYRTKVYRGHRCAHVFQHILGFGSLCCIAIVMLSAELELGLDDAPPLSTTMISVLTLSAIYFSVQGMLWFGAVARDVFDKSWMTLQNTILAANASLSFCPLLCVLFVACRVRALQITNQQGNPPWSAQNSLFLCVAAVVMQLLCCLSLPIFTGAASSVDADGNVLYDLRPMVGAYAVTVVKYVALFSLYGGVAGICWSILTMTPAAAVASKTDMHEFVYACIELTLMFFTALIIATVLSSAKVVGLAIKFGIESVDRVFLGIDLTVQRAALNACRGFVNVRGLVAHNPEGKGYTTPYLLRIDKMTVKVNIGRLFSSFGKIFEITELVIEGVEVNYEKGSGGNSSNVRTVLDFIDSAGEARKGDGGKKPKPETDPGSSPSGALAAGDTPATASSSSAAKPEDVPAQEGTHIELKHLRIIDIGAQVVLPRIGPVAKVGLGDLDIPDFSTRMSGTGSASELVSFVLRTLLKTAGSNFEVIGALVTGGAKHVMSSAVGHAKACGDGALLMLSTGCRGGINSAPGSSSKSLSAGVFGDVDRAEASDAPLGARDSKCGSPA